MSSAANHAKRSHRSQAKHYAASGKRARVSPVKQQERRMNRSPLRGLFSRWTKPRQRQPRKEDAVV